MPRTLQSEPRRDGYRMPGEFEPHAGCWMLWPERPDNWRLGAKPAQLAFAAVAAAIAGSEPVTVGVSARAVRERAPAAAGRRARRRDLEQRRVDARRRTHVRRQRSRRHARRGLDVQRLGRTRGRALFPVGPGRRGRAESAARSRAATAIARPSSSKAARSTWTGRAR